MRAPLLTVLTSLGLGLSSCGGAEEARTVPAHDGPNVLFVSIDTLRADHLGVYGYPRPTSPRIDAFARDAVVFDECRASASWTLPGMASVFTSTYTSTNRCWNLGSRLDESFTTMTEALLAEGYDTACVVSHLFCTTRHGLQQGFVHFDDSFAYPAVDPLEATTSHLISDRGIAFLEDKARVDDGRPWMLWLHYFDPHDDYMPQAGFTEAFVEEGREPTLVDLYDGEIAYTDHHVGRVFDALAEQGLAEDTVVVLVADHGEEFGDHGGSGHGATLFREQIRVPFLVRAPGIPPGRIEAPVRTIDLMPTVLSLCGLETPAQAVGHALLGPEADLDPSRAALSETRMNPTLELESVVTDSWKLVRDRRSGERSLYDLATDVKETVDRAGDEARQLERLTTALDELVAEAHRRSADYSFARAQLDPGTQEQLEDLGYADAGQDEELPSVDRAIEPLAPERGRETRETTYADGTPWARVELENGLPDGIWKTWNRDGSPKSEGAYLAGRRTGPWRTWHPDGKPLSRGRYENGRQVGLWEYWFESGRPANRGTYRDGHLVGTWETWFGNGELRSSADFDENGLQHGVSRLFAEDGHPREEVRFEHGVPTRQRYYHPGGARLAEGALSGGAREGRWRFWNHDGTFNERLSGHYENGAKVAPLGETLEEDEEPFEL